MSNKISRRDFLILMGAGAAAFALTSCSGTGDSGVGTGNLPQLSGRSLVIYFSGTGNTRRVAQAGAEALGADIYEITPVQPYTSADLNYYNSNSRVIAEHNDPALRPEIAGALPDLTEYDNIFIGYPLWWREAPNIVWNLVEQLDFTDKTVVPFCTSTSDGIRQSENTLKALAKGSNINWVDGYRFSSGTSADAVANLIRSANL